MVHVLLAHGDEPARQALTGELSREGYTVLPCATGEEALRLAHDGRPGAALIDHALGDMRGLDLCRTLKRAAATEHVAVILLGAPGSEIDRVVSFELGADDYVEKPVTTRELLLRLDRCLGRRAAPALRDVVSAGTLRIERHVDRVSVNGRPVALTPTEGRLFMALCSAHPRVLSRSEIQMLTYGGGARCDKRTIDAHVRHLRDKLKDLACAIETVKRVGYRLVVDARGDAARADRCAYEPAGLLCSTNE